MLIFTARCLDLEHLGKLRGEDVEFGCVTDEKGKNVILMNIKKAKISLNNVLKIIEHSKGMPILFEKIVKKCYIAGYSKEYLISFLPEKEQYSKIFELFPGIVDPKSWKLSVKSVVGEANEISENLEKEVEDDLVHDSSPKFQSCDENLTPDEYFSYSSTNKPRTEKFEALKQELDSIKDKIFSSEIEEILSDEPKIYPEMDSSVTTTQSTKPFKDFASDVNRKGFVNASFLSSKIQSREQINTKNTKLLQATCTSKDIQCFFDNSSQLYDSENKNTGTTIGIELKIHPDEDTSRLAQNSFIGSSNGSVEHNPETSLYRHSIHDLEQSCIKNDSYSPNSKNVVDLQLFSGKQPGSSSKSGKFNDKQPKENSSSEMYNENESQSSVDLNQFY